jgi:23S rRNA (guanosine2251-2'-O)-methyltransferase
VFLAEGLEPDPRLDELARLVRVETVPRERIEAMAHGNHQGVAAELAPREFASLKGLLASQPSLVLALDGIQDPQNLGAILRSADAAGVDGVVLPERRSAPVTGAVVKASSGASEHVRLVRVSGLASAVSDVKRAGLWCVALDVSGDLAPWEFDFRQPTCIVVGGEEGVHRLVRQRCDARLRIPMAGRVESLNASAAAAAILYEVTRQRALDSGLR